MSANESSASRAIVPPAPSAQDIAEANASAPQPSTKPKNFLERFSLNGKVAIVTGGARGLGYSMAEGLCSVGAEAIVILDVSMELGLDAAKRLHEAYGVKSQFYKADVRDETSVNEIMDSVAEEFGHIDVVVNSAGVADLVHAEDYPADKFRRVVDINLNGSFLVSQAAARYMISQGTGGTIVFIASMSGHIVNWPQPQSAYNASKAGVRHLMKSLAAEWAVHGIRCNSISPGYMDTALNRSFKGLFNDWKGKTPMGRLGDVDELTCACIYLATPASSYCTGTDILIDGGYTII